MKTAAIICEYNPFHNGHKYQIEQIKKSHDAVICIMSGNFVQRGDIAIFDKWTRAKAALLNGADLVVELPTVFSLNTAERFAFGAASLADGMNIVDSLCFGSESGNADELYNAAKALTFEPDSVSKKIKEYLSMGMSYPRAREKAYEGIIDAELLKSPNNILALEYIRSLIKMNSAIAPVTIKRYMKAHDDEALDGNIASATAVRRLIKENKEYINYVPKTCETVYNKKTADMKGLDNILMYLLLSRSAEELSLINDVTEGLENRLKNIPNDCKTFDKICEFVKSKRYTEAKIRRILLSIILGIEKNDAKYAPEYIRVLGMNETGIALLSEIKKSSALPIITKATDFKGFNRSFELDIKASNIYALTQYDMPLFSDYLTTPIIIRA